MVPGGGTFAARQVKAAPPTDSFSSWAFLGTPHESVKTALTGRVGTNRGHFRFSSMHQAYFAHRHAAVGQFSYRDKAPLHELRFRKAGELDP